MSADERVSVADVQSSSEMRKTRLASSVDLAWHAYTSPRNRSHTTLYALRAYSRVLSRVWTDFGLAFSSKIDLGLPGSGLNPQAGYTQRLL